MRYSTYFLFQILFFIILIVNMSVVNGEKIYIVSSPDQPCPHNTIEQACITLQEFATNFSTTGPTPSELTLELLPGFHSLNYSDIVINGQRTTIYIQDQMQQFNALAFRVWNLYVCSLSKSVWSICGNAYINYVNSLVVDNCNFFNQRKSWSLEMVSNATIVGSWFLNGQVRPVLLVDRSSLLIKHSMFVNTTTAYGGSYTYCEGAAIYI